MQHQALSRTELFAYIVADALSARPDETEDRRFIRSQVAARLILDLGPGDTTELMLAGHAVMFHTLMTDSVRITLQGEAEAMRRGTRAGVIAMDHAFHRNLGKLERYQTERCAAGHAGAPMPVTATKATGETAKQQADQPAPTPPARAPAEAAPSPSAPPEGRTVAEPIAADLAGETSADAQPSGPTITSVANTSAAASNQNDPPAATPPATPLLNRAQRRLLRRGQPAR